jgi:hypothetical protein
MGKFNRSKAEQIVKDVVTNHINQYGAVVYTPTGYLPYINGERFNGMNDYQQLRGSIIKELGKVFSLNGTCNTFINVYMDKVIRNSGVKVGICNFDSNSNPTYTEPADIKSSITIEVVRDEEMDKLNSFINSI